MYYTRLKQSGYATEFVISDTNPFGFIGLTDEQYEGLKGKTMWFEEWQIVPHEKTQEEIHQEELKSARKEMAQIKRWLSDNDYVINKHTLGEYSDTDERWVTYLAERKAKLDRYNELETIVG